MDMTNLILMLKINLQEYGISSLQFILDLMIRCWRQPREGRRRSVDHEKNPKRRLFYQDHSLRGSRKLGVESLVVGHQSAPEFRDGAPPIRTPANT